MRSPALIALLLGAVACGAPGPVPARPATPPPTLVAGPAAEAGAPPPAPPVPERVTADTPRTTAEGSTFTVPRGWTILSAGALSVLEAPEPDTHLAIFEGEAAGADAAVAAAWAAYRPDAQRRLRSQGSRPARQGWEEHRVYTYETSPNERAVVFAEARRRGGRWTVLVVDATTATLERRAVAVKQVQGSLRPQGYTRASLAGRPARPLDAARVAAVVGFVEESMRVLGIPGAAVSLVEDGKVVFEGGLGVRELGKPAPVDRDTLFAIASNTKALTTLLLARLVDEGKIAWDTRVTSVLPSFRLGDAATTARVEVAHLVCACTGLPRQDLEWIFAQGKITPERGLSFLATMVPTSGFGEVFQYSNVLAAAGGWVAGHVVHPDRDLGSAYDAAMRELIFAPLGMQRTRFDLDQVVRDDHASAHADDIHGHPAVRPIAKNLAIVPFRPAGGAWASVHDLTRYVLLEMDRGKLPDGRRFVSEANLLARRAPRVTAAEDATYGMGIYVDTGFGVPMVHHGGSLFGYKSDWILFPDQRVGAVILTNSDKGQLLLRPFARRVAEVVFDGRPEAAEDVAARAAAYASEQAEERARLSLPADTALVSLLAARYRSPELGAFAVKKRGADTVFDFGGFSTAVASRRNDDGTASFVAIDPGEPRLVDVAGARPGRRVLVLRDAQHEYVFSEE
jgi:CubicO group peptidase (beta-lactamase class C family)